MRTKTTLADTAIIESKIDFLMKKKKIYFFKRFFGFFWRGKSPVLILI
jgi:hypothetical protein